MVEINDGYHCLKMNLVGTKWCIIYNLKPQYDMPLNAFIGKYFDLNWLEENMFWCN